MHFLNKRFGVVVAGPFGHSEKSFVINENDGRRSGACDLCAGTCPFNTAS